MATTTETGSHISNLMVGVSGIPRLEGGDHLDQPTFHVRYEAMPSGVRAELIHGVVYMSSPTRPAHAEVHAEVVHWLGTYRMATPGVRALNNVTIILGEECELQPDACLLVSAERGGKVREADGYLYGPPELIVEVASSSESYDLHSKKRDYERAGVREYAVVVLRQQQVQWFVLRDGQLRSAGSRRGWNPTLRSVSRLVARCGGVVTARFGAIARDCTARIGEPGARRIPEAVENFMNA